MQEMQRQGQVFFVHNRVESIFQMASLLQRLLPTARIGVAHGQMGEKDLERAMLKFMQGEYDVLVATSLIENGLDIPRANTIIVNHADKLGLADLYQLRGRVGRSSRRAYAFFLIGIGRHPDPHRPPAPRGAEGILRSRRGLSPGGAGPGIARRRQSAGRRAARPLERHRH